MRYVCLFVLLSGCATDVWYDINTGKPSGGESFEERWRSTHEVTGTIPKEVLKRR